MGDIFNFPTWVFEKERELQQLEDELTFQYHVLDIENKKLNSIKRSKKSTQIVGFVSGMIVGAGIVLLLLMPHL